MSSKKRPESKVVYDLFETNEEMYPVIEAGGMPTMRYVRLIS